jgi:hypothetical protein
MRTLFLLVSVPLTLVFFSSAQQAIQPAPLNLMPMPSNYQLTSDQMTIDQSFSVALTGHQEARLDSAVQRFLGNLSRRTGMPLTAQPVDPAQAKLLIHTALTRRPQHRWPAPHRPPPDRTSPFDFTRSFRT